MHSVIKMEKLHINMFVSTLYTQMPLPISTYASYLIGFWSTVFSCTWRSAYPWYNKLLPISRKLKFEVVLITKWLLIANKNVKCLVFTFLRSWTVFYIEITYLHHFYNYKMGNKMIRNANKWLCEQQNVFKTITYFT